MRLSIPLDMEIPSELPPSAASIPAAELSWTTQSVMRFLFELGVS